MKRPIVRYGAALGLILAASLTGTRMAQASGTPQYPTAFSVNYFNNPGTAGLDELYIQNETNNGNSLPGTSYCAMVYAFYPDQEMVGCCGVPITPNETFTNSIGQLLIGIDEAGPLPVKGTIKLVATQIPPGGVCDPTDDTGPSLNQAPHALTAWITHTTTVASLAGSFMTEEPFAQTGEPQADIFTLEDQCETVSFAGPPITCPGVK